MTCFDFRAVDIISLGENRNFYALSFSRESESILSKNVEKNIRPCRFSSILKDNITLFKAFEATDMVVCPQTLHFGSSSSRSHAK